jgi:hypothetical protein
MTDAMIKNGDFRGLFTLMMKREPTAIEVNEFYEMADKGGILPNDALWYVVMVMRRERELTVQGIEAAGKLADAKAAEIHRRIEESAVKNATAKLEASAPAIAQKAVRISHLRWVCATLVISLVALVGSCWYAYQQGIEQGRAQAGVMTTWAGTRDGKLAYELWKAGDLHRLATCDNKGWERQKSDGEAICVVNPIDGGKNVSVWRLPQ